MPNTDLYIKEGALINNNEYSWRFLSWPGGGCIYGAEDGVLGSFNYISTWDVEKKQNLVKH